MYLNIFHIWILLCYSWHNTVISIHISLIFTISRHYQNQCKQNSYCFETGIFSKHEVNTIATHRDLLYTENTLQISSIWTTISETILLNFRRRIGVSCQKQVSRTGTSNYIPQYLWDVIICPCPWYPFVVQHSSVQHAMGLYQLLWYISS